MAAYATVDDLVPAYVATAPDSVDLLLARASRDVDRALLCSVYDATDTAVIEALRDATCEQVAGNLAAGDKTGAGTSTPASFSLGKLSVSRTIGGNPAAQATKIGGLWSQAWAALQLAGLTGQGPGEPVVTW